MPTRDSSGGIPVDCFDVTPDDGQDLPRPVDGVNVATAGEVAFISALGNSRTVTVAAGIAFPMRMVRILATGTTAAGIRGLVRT